MHKMLVTETYFGEPHRQNLYYLMLPDVLEDGFYRAVSSFNAFFNSLRNPKANVTEVRQFTANDAKEEVSIRRQWKSYQKIDWKRLRTFDSIWAFYDFIGYSYKTRTYKSGEVRKIWNGRYFVVPKKKS